MIIQCTDLEKSIEEKTIIKKLDLSVEKGRVFALLGPNGSGKTTTVRLLTGLLKADNGQVSLFGEQLTPQTANHLRERIGVQNDGNLYENLSVKDNLILWGQMYGMDKDKAESRMKMLLDIFQLSDRLNSHVGSLSKGMRQKVLLARALLHQPELLILDEPTSGLDPESIEELMHYLDRIVKKEGVTVIMCTHQLQGLEAIVDDVAIIKHGQLLMSGEAEKLIAEEWPEKTYQLAVQEVEGGIAICQSFGKTKRVDDSHHIILELEVGKKVSDVIAALVKANVAINSVYPMEHTIKELYFRVVEGE